MFRKKQMLELVMACTLAAGMISGCSMGKTEETAPPAKESAVASAADENVTIHFAYWVAENDSLAKEQFYSVVKKFNEKYPNIEVVLDTQSTNKSDEFEQKYNLLLLSGDTTDIIGCQSLASYAVKADKGLLEPIDDFMATDGTKIADYTVDTTQKGKIYGLPAESNASLVFLNKNALDEAGLEVPPLNWTWEDYREYASKLTKEDGGKKRYGSVAPFWGDPVMYYLGVAQSKEDNPLYKDENTHNFDDPVLREWLEYKNQLENIDKSEISYVDYTTSSLNYNAEFFNGNSAMLVTGIFALPYITNVEMYPHDFKTVVTMAPKWKDSSDGVERDSCPVLAVNKNADSAHKEAAYKFIKFYTSEGLIVRNLLPSYKNVNYEALTDALVNGQDELVDREALMNYFTYDKRHSHTAVTTPASNAELQGILKEEGDKYLSGGQTIDEAINNMIKRADTVMKK